jgi:DNA-binding GntR family transcriptional regulator
MADDAVITRSVLSEQVKGRLLQAILDGRYPPGARIVETRVAREFGTSQAPVREALRDLEALGVVENSPFRGARVRQPSIEELNEAFDVRAILEVHGARLASARLTESDLAKLDGLLEQMRQAAVAGDPYAEAVADAQFHGHIMHRSGNLTLERVWRTLEPFLRTYITIVSPGVDRRAVADRHIPILDALRSGDAARIERAYRTHFEAAARSLADVWPDGGAVAASGPGVETTGQTTGPADDAASTSVAPVLSG